MREKINILLVTDNYKIMGNCDLCSLLYLDATASRPLLVQLKLF